MRPISKIYRLRKTPAILAGKTLRTLSRIKGGGGSALPGLVTERLDPGFLPWALGQLPRGVVVVSGTNGKTTTTKIVVELLESQGLKVFTNKSGSNFTRGVAAEAIAKISLAGTLDADIAVLELDEAHAVRFVRIVKPRYSLLLNVMRDQLDRFGEIDTTARMLASIARATTSDVVINREDARLRAIGGTLGHAVYYGLGPDVKHQFPSDDELYANGEDDPANVTAPALPDADVVLTHADGGHARFEFDDAGHEADLALRGSYNIFNAAAAIALTRAVMAGEFKPGPMLERLAIVRPAFGRGETITVDGTACELVLIKNPGGFRLALSSFDAAGYATMIAINDAYADGRDVSWLWDVSYDSLRPGGVASVSGTRAYDMALRLRYDDVAVGSVEPDLERALAAFLASNASLPKRIYCTYTAMLSLRRLLRRRASVESAL